MKNGTNLADPRSVRQHLGMNQHEFWSRIGVTQSGGSRYESGRRMPKPVKALLTLAYGKRRAAEDLMQRLRGA